MNSVLQALQFSNLLEISSLSAEGGESYEKQEELISIFRKTKKPFLAIMPMRNRTRCEICKVERGDSIFHFENPTVSGAEGAQNIMWGTTVGVWAQVETEELHNVLAHGLEPSQKLKAVLSSVSC